MEAMKSNKLEYGSKGVMGGHGVAGPWSDEVATDGTRTKHGHGEGTRHKEVGKAGSEEPTKRSLEPIWGVERELRRCGLKAGEDGKRWAGARVNLGKGGQKVGKWTGFSHFGTALTHLFPHVSTQVVDFPRICTVRLFGEEGFHRRDTETQRQAWLGTNIEKLSMKKCEDFHDVSRFFTVYHPVEARNYAMFTFFRVRPFLNDEARKSKRVDTDRRRGGLFLLDGPGWAMYLGGSGD